MGVAIKQNQQVVAAFEKHAETIAVSGLNPVEVLTVERYTMSEIRVFVAQSNQAAVKIEDIAILIFGGPVDVIYIVVLIV